MVGVPAIMQVEVFGCTNDGEKGEEFDVAPEDVWTERLKSITAEIAMLSFGIFVSIC